MIRRVFQTRVMQSPSARAAGTTLGVGGAVAGLFFAVLKYYFAIEVPTEIVSYGTTIIIFAVNRFVAQYSE